MQTSIQIRLKGPFEPKVNMHGVERCAVSNCTKTKRCLTVGEHKLCFFHANQIKSKGAQLVENTSTYSRQKGTHHAETRLCHAKDCTVTYKLMRGFRGYFCQDHYNDLSFIREQLNKSRYYQNIFAEMHWRRKEIDFRKFPDTTHLSWLERLECHYGRDFPAHFLYLPDLPPTSHPQEDYYEYHPEEDYYEGHPQEDYCDYHPQEDYYDGHPQEEYPGGTDYYEDETEYCEEDYDSTSF